MQVAILSDIHDYIENLRKALKMLKNADTLICCGDLCSPFIIDELGKGFSNPTHIVFGNNDGDLFRISQRVQLYPHITLHGEFCELQLGGRKFAVNHFDNIGKAIAESQSHDVVCFGHNHRLEISRKGKTLVINPGEIMGWVSGASTFVIYDAVQHEASHYIVE